MIPGHLLSAFSHRQFHTLPGLLESRAALPNSNPNPMQGGSLYHFYDGLWYDPAERRTHDLPCERRTRYRLSQPDTVYASLTGQTQIRMRKLFCKLKLQSLCYREMMRKSRFFNLNAQGGAESIEINSSCTLKALSPGVERQILVVKISARVIQLWHAHCKRLDAAFKIHNALV